MVYVIERMIQITKFPWLDIAVLSTDVVNAREMSTHHLKLEKLKNNLIAKVIKHASKEMPNSSMHELYKYDS